MGFTHPDILHVERTGAGPDWWEYLFEEADRYEDEFDGEEIYDDE